jgi:hypothetical protein
MKTNNSGSELLVFIFWILLSQSLNLRAWPFSCGLTVVKIHLTRKTARKRRKAKVTDSFIRLQRERRRYGVMSAMDIY